MSNEYVIITMLTHFKSKFAIPRAEFEALNLSEPLDQSDLLTLINNTPVKEFSQTHLGDVVGDVSLYTEEDVLTIFDVDNQYLSGWTKEKKLDWINKWKDV